VVQGGDNQQDLLEVKPPLQCLFNSTSLTLVRRMPCIIIVASISYKRETCSCCHALAKPGVHHHNRVSKTRVRVVA